MQGRVHFAALFCVDYDMDLLPHWTAHYSRFNYDSYFVYLHSRKKLTPAEHRAYLDIFDNYGFGATWVEGEFRDGKLRDKYLSAHQAGLMPGDYMAVADSDEFQQIPDPEHFKKSLFEYDFAEGYLVDRWGDELVDADTDTPLEKQYPYEGNLRECASLIGMICSNRRKIIAARRDIHVDYIGSHAIEQSPGSPILKRLGRYEVYHYSFRKSFPWRMIGKSYFRSRDLWQTLRYFGQDDHPALQEMLAQEDRIQSEMGWIPARSRTL